MFYYPTENGRSLIKAKKFHHAYYLGPFPVKVKGKNTIQDNSLVIFWFSRDC